MHKKIKRDIYINVYRQRFRLTLNTKENLGSEDCWYTASNRTEVCIALSLSVDLV